MLTVIGKRLLVAIPSLIGVVIVTFLLTRALPGDPAAYFAGPAATKEAIQEIRVKLGLDKSLPQQFVRYVADLAKGDLGQSLTTGQPVVTEIRNHKKGTAVAVAAMVPLLVIGSPKTAVELALEPIVSAIRESAQTGRIGDGKIFVYSIEQAIRIRTGEFGDDAL